MRVAFLYNQPSEDPSHQADDDPDNSPIVTALERNGHDVHPIACTLDLLQLHNRLEQLAPEVVFNRVDSLGGSDAMQAAVTLLLDAMRLPYTGCPTAAIVATASKIATKERLAGAGLPTPGWVTAEGNDCGLRIADCGFKTPAATQQSAIHNPKFLLKSVYEHASFQINDASVLRPETSEQLANHLRRREAKTGRPFFAEEYIDGREFNLALWGDQPESLPPAEIDFSAFPAGKPKIIGHSAKWDTDSFEYDQTPHRFDFPPEDRPLLRRLDDLAIECWQLFGLCGYARVDFRVDHHGQPWILEINTNPCLSPGAGFSVALQQAGIAYDEGIQRILEMAAPAQSPPAIACMNQPSRAPARSPRSTSMDDHVAFTADNCLLRYEITATDRGTVRTIVAGTGFFRPEEVDVAVELVDERLARGPNSGYFFVFGEVNGAPAGYACYGPIACTTASFDLYWIAVAPQWQRGGLGRKLMAAVEQQVAAARGRRIYIDTSSQPQYAPTRAFYERNGYQIAARLTDFYAPGDDRVIYVKVLNSSRQ